MATLGVAPPLPPQDTSNTSSPQGTLNGKKMLAYIVGGGVLILSAQVVPRFAVATAVLIFVASALSHANQLSALGSYIQGGTS